MNDKSVLFFLHVPKAAGSTLHVILDRHYPPSETYTIDGLDVRASIEKFVNLPSDELERLKLVKGHMPFGLHRYIASPTAYVTFLREPVERVISYYYYVRRSPSHYLHQKVVRNNLSLQGFVEARLTTEVYDFQTKLIAGVESELHRWEYDHSLLEKAVTNLDRYFSVVGVSELFDESLLLMKYSLGWHFWPFYRKQNVTKGRAKIDRLPDNTIQLIYNGNSLDSALYEHALRKLRAGLILAGITRGRVVLFRLLNRVYNLTRFGATSGGG
ncbi:MAG: sulfotransferase family 2 domain-containing protein [Desulfobulbaceae bacterium]|jgi:hypothetical protein